MTTPKRIQRKRTKGFKLPEDCVYVGRPTKWGNPFTCYSGRAPEVSVAMYRRYMLEKIRTYIPNAAPQYRGLNIEELRGKDLACWCGEGDVCHATVLIELANQPIEAKDAT